MINIQNSDDGECLKWYLVRYLNPADHHRGKNKKSDKDCAGKLLILENTNNDCFEINGKQVIKMANKGETVKFKNFSRKIKSPFMIYSDLE